VAIRAKWSGIAIANENPILVWFVKSNIGSAGVQVIASGSFCQNLTEKTNACGIKIAASPRDNFLIFAKGKWLHIAIFTCRGR